MNSRFNYENCEQFVISKDIERYNYSKMIKENKADHCMQLNCVFRSLMYVYMPV